MNKKVSTPEIEKFIIDHAFTMSSYEISKTLLISRSVVRRVYKENMISVPEELKKKWQVEKQYQRTTFTQEEDRIIIENYMTLPVKTIGKLIGRSFTGITTRLKHLGLEIPTELRVQRKTAGLFRKGQVPPNKGKKMSPELYERYKHTFFKKEHIPHNAKKDWDEVLRKDGTGNEYWMIKIPTERKLIFKHVWLWESQNGKVKKGYNIVFRNGISTDCRIENLESISNSELMSRNTMNRFPEDLRQVILLKGALKRQINKIEKANTNG
ncbi:HNH endonuclease signature motif containing protein [Chryseobacterium sp. PTM-20240506]|uniref:HNH endonuclease signature motif containing protein n=1 Tax=Chryseobacterium sp. PTM-20240506 TaxID=3400631 RepID=UPI003AADB4E6